MKPINFQKWIDENRHLLKPPVGNQQIWLDRELMVTVVGGPNARNDYHVNEGEEFFYQVEGTMTLRVLEDGKPHDIRIGPGEIFLLPGNVPHSPQRPANTIGMVLERRRLAHEIDSFLWICEHCGAQIYKESLHLENLVTQLPPVFERFWNNAENSTCKQCGVRMTKPGPAA